MILNFCGLLRENCYTLFCKLVFFAENSAKRISQAGTLIKHFSIANSDNQGLPGNRLDMSDVKQHVLCE